MIPVQIWNTLRYKNPEDWSEFVLSNQRSHDAIETSISTSLGQTYARVPFFTPSGSDQLAHWAEHVTIANLQGTQEPQITELTWDPASGDSFYDFLAAHAYYHQIAESSAGLY